ncbi:tail fiber assembly protein [Pseudomonas sp. BYT-5]|uniref:tail fiber assembly protein n=1 Tax=Pseudomonas sp. BYT-5 TaxID=2944392 RepID=UPI0020223549|nr:tail fiber assembly protein [Pseudomonas sp. BYT-5]URD40642.1 tail fiber assembly protein [Pseudomonas sp. BYT-5]
MIIKLSPGLSDNTLSVSRLGDMLTLNNVALDFAQLPEGATLPAEAVSSEWVLDPIKREGGKLIVSLRLPHALDAPQSALFPDDIIDPPDGPVTLPGLEVTAPQPSATGVIDWSQLITAEDKAQAAAEQLLSHVAVEVARLRAVADSAIAPLQDAVDLDEATEAEAALLKEWKRYRVALNRLPDQPGYPNEITWPAPPA